MIMDTKEKEKKIRLRFYNIVIHPADKHKPEFYIQLCKHPTPILAV